MVDPSPGTVVLQLVDQREVLGCNDAGYLGGSPFEEALHLWCLGVVVAAIHSLRKSIRFGSLNKGERSPSKMFVDSYRYNDSKFCIPLTGASESSSPQLPMLVERQFYAFCQGNKGSDLAACFEGEFTQGPQS